ncbi:unnamed protein product [Cylindrotheca closterium]|uniref:Uncharacterized protein n=1 Tax=Cylindrotheca closterium TaxID=2856 RepID=A0AAD2FKE3_9STRA|nr:unnamed protein product [Cylindrotheca closterium]
MASPLPDGSLAHSIKPTTSATHDPRREEDDTADVTIDAHDSECSPSSTLAKWTKRLHDLKSFLTSEKFLDNLFLEISVTECLESTLFVNLSNEDENMSHPFLKVVRDVAEQLEKLQKEMKKVASEQEELQSKQAEHEQET